MSRLTEDFIAEFEELMKKELHMTSGEFFNGGKHILEKHKLLKQVNQILPKFFFDAPGEQKQAHAECQECPQKRTDYLQHWC